MSGCLMTTRSYDHPPKSQLQPRLDITAGAPPSPNSHMVAFWALGNCLTFYN